MRDSTSLWFLDELKKYTDNISGYDPVIKKEKLEFLPELMMVQGLSFQIFTLPLMLKLIKFFREMEQMSLLIRKFL